MKKSHKKELTKGIFKENPTFVLLLGLCPTLGVTTMVSNAIGMGFSVLFVLTCSNIMISLLRKVIPDSVRIPSYIVIIASFVTIIEMVLHAFVPDVYTALGVFLPLIVVNCIILGRAEAFASKNTVFDSILDGIGMGIGFTLALILIAAIREIFGSGTITLFPMGSFNGVIKIPFLNVWPIRVMTLAPGALLLMGYLKAYFEFHSRRQAKKEKLA
ncbi:MAG: electron transport complex subunit E [Sphaerochaetaceae bacterium]|jgi:electron transport complex protein RnfE|nr:electron transport complex subunit E [Sphaerochaetaceae bacterium]MDC7237096.1 electron transport complex subunit E [Sphaerochaetaceae bacterium]MDC7243130.1 electron transport complex subunit E [Sphaerochaetaceae bacterium]MDC7248694.1 electron transport complex subunit E [Sphaerochaetaceae bacterium]